LRIYSLIGDFLTHSGGSSIAGTVDGLRICDERESLNTGGREMPYRRDVEVEG